MCDTSEFFRIACPVCGNEQHMFERELNGYPLVKCGSCAMVFCNPRPDEDSLIRAYRELQGDAYDAYFGTHEVDIAAWHNRPTKSQLANFNRLLQWVARVQPRGRLLDIGCSQGYFLDLARRMGYEPHGVEVTEVPEETRKRCGIFQGSMTEAGFPDNYFQIISAQALIEHVTDPSGFLEQVWRLLVPGGILLLSGVPNYHSLWIRLGKDRFIGNQPMTHLNYFTIGTLKRLLTVAKLRILQQRSWGISETLLYDTGWESNHPKNKRLKTHTALLACGKVVYRPVNALLDMTGTGSVIELLAKKE